MDKSERQTVSSAIVTSVVEHKRLESNGVAIQVLVASSDTGGRYSSIDYSLPPTGIGPPLHFHEHMHESFHVTEGSVSFQAGEKRIEAAAGTMIHVPPGLPHAFWNSGPEPARMIMTFVPGGFELYLEELLELLEANSSHLADMRPLMAELAAKHDVVVVGPPPGKAIT